MHFIPTSNISQVSIRVGIKYHSGEEEHTQYGTCLSHSPGDGEIAVL
jgi:hypothetical protein